MDAKLEGGRLLHGILRLVSNFRISCGLSIRIIRMEKLTASECVAVRTFTLFVHTANRSRHVETKARWAASTLPMPPGTTD
jgi:hypothetical protein